MSYEARLRTLGSSFRSPLPFGSLSASGEPGVLNCDIVGVLVDFGVTCKIPLIGESIKRLHAQKLYVSRPSSNDFQNKK